jgi:hypothetical protein
VHAASGAFSVAYFTEASGLLNRAERCNALSGGVSKSMLTLNEAIIDVKKG